MRSDVRSSIRRSIYEDERFRDIRRDRRWRGSRSRMARRRRIIMRRRLAMAMAAIIVILFVVLVCIKITAKETIAENNSKFSKKYYKSYMIETGDTLWDIADKECGIQWKDNWDYIDEVMQINGLRSERIQAGNYLTLPYYT